MIPKFDSLVSMLHFMRELPKNTDYRKMLIDDFNYDVPSDSQAWQAEYFVKYLIQGQFKGITGEELRQYAYNNTMKIKDKYYVDLKDSTNSPKINTVRIIKSKVTHPDGTIIFNTTCNKFEGFCLGRVVSRATTINKVKVSMTKLHKVSEFNVI